MLLWCEIEEIIRIKIGAKPQKYDSGISDKTGTIFHCRKEGNQKNPECNVIYLPDNRLGVKESLFC